MLDKDIKINVDRSEPDGGLDPSEEARNVAADSAAADAEVAKLVSDLQELQQTLQRRQADFENYRKRVEKERADDSKRAIARVVEALIPVIDGFEHALAAHREADYETYRKGFELIYKQLLDNVTKLGTERVDRICIRPWIAPRPRTTKTVQFSRSFSRATSFTDACCGRRWCV